VMVGAARLEDRLGPDEPPYKSRGEAQVGRLLNRYGIPFFYEKPLIVHDRGQHRIWHPDFTLPQYAWLLVEYAGMPDRPDYMAGIRHKQAAFQNNGIPAVFIYPQDLQGGDWPTQVHQKIVGAYRRVLSAAPVTRYPARSVARPYRSRFPSPCSRPGYRR
jgi:hypothetical protein